MKIFERQYTDESLVDLCEHLYHLIETTLLPKDEWGFIRGNFKVSVEWEDETPD